MMKNNNSEFIGATLRKRWVSNPRSSAIAACAVASSVASVLIYDQMTSSSNRRNNMTIANCESESSTPPPSAASKDNKNRSKLVFLGTGSSTGCPKPLCAIIGSLSKSEQDDIFPSAISRCHTSQLASVGDPKYNKNYRNNPSLLISKCNSTTKECKNVVIDVGKTFREGALRWFPEHGITSLDAVVLTHHHMDAAGGLDDIRGFQGFMPTKSGRESRTASDMPLYLSKSCLSDVAQRFPWLFPNQQAKKYTSGDQKHVPVVTRHVASFDINIVEPFKPFRVANSDDIDDDDDNGLVITPLPVYHGDDLISLAFAFSIPREDGKQTNVVYISDISKMIPATLRHIKNILPQPTHILIVDALLVDKQHSVHYSLEQAIELSNAIKPVHATYIVGMNCDDFLPHDEMNEKLSAQKEKNGGKVQLAYDGQVIYI